MSEFIEVRDGVRFLLDGIERVSVRSTGAADLNLKSGRNRHADSILFGEFVGKDWEVVRPYPTNALHEEVDPTVVAVLVKRSKRYRTALKARDFIVEKDLHEEAGYVSLRALFRSMGGTVIQPGGLSDRDAARFPGRTARVHGPGDITLFRQFGEDDARHRELMALTIADLEWESYEDGHNRGPLDLTLGDARYTHPEAHYFAAMLLVPVADAARAADLASAEEVGSQLLVDPATVQDAHQLWAEIASPVLPRV
ncbi:hypothetical protein Achl_4266 (plasmid) [Pseudarthrobacter chlorophenolicus A6]|uniref:Uncharacterized protein n=1 Tax=Pseudarthrobacter chlorophenolicus (strain ATCC 700700 / DSM 12829 / CIP 107037 / JCM 12360 / KCTC 9906 / NCIMB 13794 / A6) TaxID=452863 RepID=B8HIH0_PSECP|nr:hypothetical protein [Pseudarthrobacter chlorophenolicus]ACL42217.1 hypothetical protein Achl_4266 [Pseudarthrobacter chlorophenolicus A6]SDQ15026.1 hypothetical protein SAMN04489738_0324 [Pseudarthrobacter chlorophenolicus]